MLDVLPRGMRILGYEVERGQDHAGSAEAALDGGVVDEGLLQAVQPPILGESFNRRDRPATGFVGKRTAGAHPDAVQQDGAGAADSQLTATFGAGKLEVAPEDRLARIIDINTNANSKICTALTEPVPEVGSHSSVTANSRMPVKLSIRTNFWKGETRFLIVLLVQEQFLSRRL